MRRCGLLRDADLAPLFQWPIEALAKHWIECTHVLEARVPISDPDDPCTLYASMVYSIGRYRFHSRAWHAEFAKQGYVRVAPSNRGPGESYALQEK